MTAPCTRRLNELRGAASRPRVRESVLETDFQGHPFPRAGSLPFHAGRLRSPTRAFTLLELLIVIALLALLAALAWPRMESQLVGSELPESAERLRSLVAMTRAAAIMENRRFRIRFEPEEQQPFIEFEPDPIRQPGQYFSVEASWAREPPLLGGVQVHEVRLGRPEFLKPVSTSGGAGQNEKLMDSELSAGADVDETGESTVTNLSTTPQGEEDGDARRPSIVFESDGGSDWATLVVARLPLSELIDDNVAQKWIILDGRTGLATVRDGLTQEQLADPEIVIAREKLELPDEGAEPEDFAANLAGGPAPPGQAAGAGIDATAAMGQLSGQATQQLQQVSGEQAQPLAPQTMDLNPGQDQQPPPVDPAQSVDPQEQPDDGQNPANELEEKLKNSNLSEEEKERIRKAFAQQGGKK